MNLLDVEIFLTALSDGESKYESKGYSKFFELIDESFFMLNKLTF